MGTIQVLLSCCTHFSTVAFIISVKLVKLPKFRLLFVDKHADSSSYLPHLQSTDLMEALSTGSRDDNEDYVNITITAAESEQAAATGTTDNYSTSVKDKKLGNSHSSSKASSRSNSAGSMLRKRGKQELEEKKTPPGSPALKRKEENADAEPVGPPPGYQKKRSKSDVTLILKEKERLRQVRWKSFYLIISVIDGCLLLSGHWGSSQKVQ